MAILDVTREQIVLRIAYDGSALSGKTTSVQALSNNLNRTTFTAGEAEGRTLWFDWLDYAGGRFEGYAIRCQIVSVPGQQVLEARRRALIRAADAVVFVADGTEAGMDESVRSFQSLQVWLRSVQPGIRVIVQANKRDAPDCVSVDQLRARLGASSIAVTESVATDGTGVRETFIYAVRLALERVRELLHEKMLDRGSPDVESGEELLLRLKAETGSETLVPRIDPARPPLAPDHAIPSGMVWPPAGGRLLLKQSGPFLPRRAESGDWIDISDEQWLLCSHRDDVFDDLDDARHALIRWSCAHSTAAALISETRCIALCETGGGQWRLWQLVQRTRSLSHLLFQAVALENITHTAGLLLEGARLLVLARETMNPAWFAGDRAIAPVIAPTRTGAAFIGLMPSPHAQTPARGWNATAGVRSLLRFEMGSVIAQVRLNRDRQIPAIVDTLREGRDDDGRHEAADVLSAMLLE